MIEQYYERDRDLEDDDANTRVICAELKVSQTEKQIRKQIEENIYLREEVKGLQIKLDEKDNQKTGRSEEEETNK